MSVNLSVNKQIMELTKIFAIRDGKDLSSLTQMLWVDHLKKNGSKLSDDLSSALAKLKQK